MTRAEIMQEIINLKSELSSMESSIGDWKITKIYKQGLWVWKTLIMQKN